MFKQIVDVPRTVEDSQDLHQIGSDPKDYQITAMRCGTQPLIPFTTSRKAHRPSPDHLDPGEQFLDEAFGPVGIISTYVDGDVVQIETRGVLDF